MGRYFFDSIDEKSNASRVFENVFIDHYLLESVGIIMAICLLLIVLPQNI